MSIRETIYTLPITDVFGHPDEDGCPICRLRVLLEQRAVDAILGAAMMEPDIRIQTNQTGFCRRHFLDMLGAGNRLSLALMLESHLETLRESLHSFQHKKQPAARLLSDLPAHCYICEQVDTSITHMLDNLCTVWKNDPDFRVLYQNQPYLCIQHTGMLLQKSQTLLKGVLREDFQSRTKTLCEQQIESLKNDVTRFCRSYDYRSQNEPPLSEEEKKSIARSVGFLCGEHGNMD